MKHKIGFSLGYCVADIVHNKVDINDVLAIFCGTLIRLDTIDCPKDFNQVWFSYTQSDGPWDRFSLDKKEIVLQIIGQLHREGRIIQPRLDGKRALKPPNTQYHWFDVIPVDSSGSLPSAVQDAYQELQVVSQLCGVAIHDAA